MLAPYPIIAAAENWVHEAICAKVQGAIASINAGDPVAAWADGLAPELVRDALASRYDRFCGMAENLTTIERDLLAQSLAEQNNIPAVFDGVSPCPRLDSLPLNSRESIKQLFSAAFDALKALNVRDRQYQMIYDSLPGKCCPFCGIEPFEAPGLAREDLDHYLPFSRYPFAGANLRNLAPMGGKCNASYKLATDVLSEASGARRRCFDPYGTERVTVTLAGSVPFEGEVIDLVPHPAWEIGLTGTDAQAVETWENVFHIRRRYRDSILDAFFREWVDDFTHWCAREVGPIPSQAEVVDALRRYLEAVLPQGTANANFLRRALFEMMRQRCDASPAGDRLVAWFTALVDAQRALAA
jgi:hypothetical protein